LRRRNRRGESVVKGAKSKEGEEKEEEAVAVPKTTLIVSLFNVQVSLYLYKNLGVLPNISIGS